MVFKAGGHCKAWRLVSLGFGQEQDAVFRHGGIERRAQLFPVRNEFINRARVHHCARQNVGADFAAFFQHADRYFLAFLSRQLLETDRRRQAGRAAADDNDVVLHRFARAVLFKNVDWLCHGLVMGRKI